jgi:hypothetical protein
MYKVFIGLALTVFFGALLFAWNRAQKAWRLKRAFKGMINVLEKHKQEQSPEDQKEWQKMIDLAKRCHDEIEITKGINWEEE